MRMDDSLSIITEVHLSCIDSWWKLSSIQWGLTTLRCVPLCLCIACEWCSKLSICSISDGLRDVISHSVLVLIKWPSRHGSPTKANPSPFSSAQRVTGQLEQGTVTCSLLWLQLGGERSQAGDTIHRQSPNKIHLQTKAMSRGPGGHVFSKSATSSSLHYMWHLPSRTVSRDTNGESSIKYTTQRALGHTSDTPTGWLSCVTLCYTHTQLCSNPLKSACFRERVLNTSHGDAAGEWWKCFNLDNDVMILSVSLNLSAFLCDAFKV